MLDCASLFALAAVVREGSFARAARALSVTPSAVAQRIRLLLATSTRGVAIARRIDPPGRGCRWGRIDCRL